MFFKALPTERIPLKVRLVAWWRGYDIADIEERMQRKNKEDVPLLPAARKKPADDDSNRILWDKDRVTVTQLIWGNGFCGPGGPQNVIDMSKLLALSPKLSALVVGAGLGGPARVLAKEFGVWINGYESNELLAREGMKMSVKAGLEKKAPITHLDLNNSPDFERQFDRAYSKEVMFTVEKKAELIKSIYDQLKENSLFLISDYVVRNHDSLAHPDVTQWLRHEPLNPFPVTSDTMIYTLEKVGFKIRVNEDITDHYLKLINQAWANAEQAVQSLAAEGESGRKNMFAILKEADLWNRRTKIMRQKELRVCRYLAHKPAQP